jgi:2-oxoglutarate ferredoxin oxidoreductase subunit beta
MTKPVTVPPAPAARPTPAAPNGGTPSTPTAPPTPGKGAVNVSHWKEDAAHNDWCPGCGDFGILNAIQMALSELGRENHEVAVFSGIGCSGKISHFVRSYGVHTLHGRVLPFATGAKLANPTLEVLAVGGDGDGLGIGAGHFVGAGRRNVDLAYIIHDNQVYGLTKGQASPTLPGGAQPKSLPSPNINNAVNPLALALATGYTWIGRGYAYDIKNLKELIKAALNHKGMAFLDVFQPCPTYNNINTKEWYSGLDRPNKQARTYRLHEQNYNGKVQNAQDVKEVNEKRVQAYLKMVEGPDTLPLGVFFEINLPTYEEKVGARLANYKQTPPAKENIVGPNGAPAIDVGGLLDEYAVKQF